MKAVLAILAISLVLFAGCAQAPPKPANNTTACTLEAKICPDGSSVGRTGPNCEFAPCPSTGNESNVTPPPMVGNDTDEFGCKPSAGYTWCDILKKCVREWETPCVTPAYTVKTANTTLGEILVDGRGYTLYYFTADSGGNSTCYGTCAANWPPLVVGDTIAIPKGMPGDIGIILRTDNTTQVTYNGWPLYYYSQDDEPGDTNGEGVGGKWYVVEPED